jgi:hypothetical protein
MDYIARPQYIHEKFELPDREYAPKKGFITETTHYKELEYKRKKKLSRDKVEYCEKVFKKNHAFQLDLFKLADYEFVNWANQQPATHVIAVMAEMKGAAPLRPDIQALRESVKDIPLFTIEEYKKKRRLGERSTDFLKHMKTQYGNHVLRILYLTQDVNRL